MSGSYKKPFGKLFRLWSRFRTGVIQDVPEDIQFCEFECRKEQCIMGDWEKCEKRLHSGAHTRSIT